MKHFTLLLLAFFVNIAFAYSAELSADMFAFDEEEVYEELSELTNLEAQLIDNKQLSELDINAICANFQSSAYIENLVGVQGLQSQHSSGNMSYFWTTFAISAVGTFFIYSAVAGPIAVAVIYFATDKDMDKTKKAAWGCLAGTALGAAAKFGWLNRPSGK